ncbi:MAG: hypothetical protein IIB99_04335 [Planctomycetes bacterium]|nr:hypothetical protein [Planctomycetota bacterium]
MAGLEEFDLRYNPNPPKAEIDKLHASIPDQNANFGAAISLSDDGNTALIGARNEGAAGGAYIFVRQGEVWIEQAHLLPPPGGGGFFGSAVSISADGNTAMVSAAEEFARGAAYIFTRKGEQWSEPTRLAACDTGIDDQFATAVALSGDATIAIAGAIWHEEVFEYQGAAYVFDLTMAPCYGDLSCDGQVGVLDLLLLLNRWGACDNCYIGCADFTGDCVVGVPDLLILLGNWG